MDNTPGQLVLVTGATGFIGGHLARRLVETGWSVRVLARDPNRLSPVLRQRTEIVSGDLRDRAAVARAVRGARLVFHCAANVATWDRPDAYEQTNVTGTRILVEELVAAAVPGVHLLHVSTVDVYGYPLAPCTEDSPTSGGGFGYGTSKLRGETLARDLCTRAGLACTVVRPCNVIGPGSQFISRIGQELKNGLMLLVDGGKANAGLIYIDNLVNDMIHIGQHPNPAYPCFNLRDYYDVTWKEFIGAYRTALAGKGRVLSLPFAVADAAARVIPAAYRIARTDREPLLHPLIIRIFGRTCGHSAARFWQAAPERRLNRAGFDTALAASTAWVLRG